LCIEHPAQAAPGDGERVLEGGQLVAGRQLVLVEARHEPVFVARRRAADGLPHAVVIRHEVALRIVLRRVLVIHKQNRFAET